MALAALLAVPAAGCANRRAARLLPEESAAVAEARTRMAAAAGTRDTAVFFSYLAPNARLITGRDTLDLRAAVKRYQAALGAEAVPELFVAPDELRRCDRWLYESGGRMGLDVFQPGATPSSRRYRYALSWISADAGRVQLQEIAVIPTSVRGNPQVEGCRPSAREQFLARRAGITVMPGTGYVRGSAQGSTESALEKAGYVPRLYGETVNYPAAGQASNPWQVAGWVNLNRRLSLEALGTLKNSVMNTSGVDSAITQQNGLQLEQRWGAALASLRWDNLRVGAGPAFVREAWHISVDSISYDNINAIAIAGPHVANAGSTTNKVGAYVQGAFTIPLASSFYLEARGFYLWIPEGSTPPAFDFPSLKVNSSSAGLGLAVGVAF